MNQLHSILLLAAVSAVLPSCVTTDYPGGSIAPVSTSIAFGTYDTLPGTYVGDAYYHQNRYYYGGNYQRGSYYYQGRQYNDRYYHNGQYYYGGRHEHHQSRPVQQSYNNNHDIRRGHDDNHRSGNGRY